MKFYIVGPEHKGEGGYLLITEQGEVIAQHFCSSSSFARNDLERARPERQMEWRAKYGEYEVLYLGQDEMTEDDLLKRNHVFSQTENHE